MVGTWQRCIPADGGGVLDAPSNKEILSFNANGDVMLVSAGYSTSDCSGDSTGGYSFTGKYTKGGASSTVSGAFNLDITDMVWSVENKSQPTVVYTIAKFDSCNTLVFGKQVGATDDSSTPENRNSGLDTDQPHSRLTL